MILIGYPSSGKSYWGKRLAKKLGVSFIDTDARIASSCRVLARYIGEKAFRVLEKKVIQNLKPHNSAIIALGGGALLDVDNRIHLASLGPLIYLQIDKQVLKKRLLQQDVPSYLDPHYPEESFEKMYEERKTIYENCATVTITLTGKTDETILEELHTLYEQYIWHPL